MTNTNCLDDIRCPACGQEDRFKITALITCVVTDNGSEPVGDHDWDDDSSTHCPECGFDGKLKSFRKRNRLPPDPNNMNDNRAAWAAVALRAFMEVTGTDEEDALVDLHWCDCHNFDFELALDRARRHYEEETTGERPR
jgi:rubredoxin